MRLAVLGVAVVVVAGSVVGCGVILVVGVAVLIVVVVVAVWSSSSQLRPEKRRANPKRAQHEPPRGPSK